jgi:hypothetical protein
MDRKYVRPMDIPSPPHWRSTGYAGQLSGNANQTHTDERHEEASQQPAVSQIIAALLLIAIATAAAILLHVFSIGLLGSLGSGGAA